VSNDRAYSYLGPRALLRPSDHNTRIYARFGLGELKVSAPLAKRDKADYSDPAGDEHTQTALTQAGRSIEARLAWHF